nr:MAG TPA: hypothetical protein [Caudoviricetes sp.]
MYVIYPLKFLLTLCGSILSKSIAIIIPFFCN